jgi:adenylosuccinate synthase
MTVTVVIGLQWGDEGKGKVTDYYADRVDYVVRYQGGDNAGHTVVIGKDVFKLHFIPSGVLRKNATVVMGNGMVVDPKGLLDEMNELTSRGADVDNLLISERAHVILPFHKVLDGAEENWKRPGKKIGTTRKGIGPTYSDKASRSGIRFMDLVGDEKRLREKLGIRIDLKKMILQGIYGDSTKLDKGRIIENYVAYGKKLKKHVCDTSLVINRAIDEGKDVLFEGAQGTHLDIDFGTYPYVTSSNTIAGGACAGAGVGPTRIDNVIGVTKAYTTRVGEGPFPTETEGRLGGHLRERGKEFGTTTGRPRRCGWFDTVVVRYSCRLNSPSALALTKLDVLDGLEELRICTAYRYKGKTIKEFPADLEMLQECEPVYETLEGWEGPINRARAFTDLPANAQKYVRRVESFLGVPVMLIGVGPERDEMVLLSR